MKGILFIILIVITLGLAIAAPATSTLAPQAATIVVNSTADSGPGTLRQALLKAQGGDTITFDTAVFPPTAPAAIRPSTALPELTQGDLTVDASNAGVILDGSAVTGQSEFALTIVSNGNSIRGLQIVNFPANAIGMHNVQNNTIGGDRSTGAGPLGQGNLLSGNGGVGIGLWNMDNTSNTITGNYIGVALNGVDPFPNLGSGIFIDLSAHNNRIGPNNIIAFNEIDGVGIDDTSPGNTVTRNSIHDNRYLGIDRRGDTTLRVPLLLDFDLAAGTVNGLTCAGCTVEIFSDAGFEGAIYEGVAVANARGFFTFNKGAPFSGPQLTATATDAGGSTSPFSWPTIGPSRSTTVQAGNNRPKIRLRTAQASELADNRMGTGGSFDRRPHDPGAAGYLRQMNEMGQKWALALSIDYLEWDPVAVNGQYSTYDIDPTHAAAFSGLADLGIEVVYSLAFWDEEIASEPCYARFRDEEEIQRYLDYIQFLVHNFKDDIQTYQTINEPRYNECMPFNQQNIELDDYIDVTRRAIQVIRQEQPGAKIVVGATVLFHEEYYLHGILESDLMPLVDGISWHPFYGHSPEYEPAYYYNYPATVQEIKDVAEAHGFNGDFITEEIGWDTAETASPGQPVYSQIAAAKYYARGILLHLGLDVIAGYGGIDHGMAEEQWLEMQVVRNLSTLMAGAESQTLPLTIRNAAANIRSYTFSTPHDGHLVALWTDGIAQDYDPGVPVTITLPGFAGHTAMAIDVLHDFEQPLLSSVEDGDLVIRGLRVKDYPLLLRITPDRHVNLPVVIK